MTQQLISLIDSLFLWFVLHAGHHVGHYLPNVHGHARRVHLRVLWQTIRWFYYHIPQPGRFVKP